MKKQTKQEDISLQRFLMVMIALQHYSQLIQDQDCYEEKTKILKTIEQIEQYGIQVDQFRLIFSCKPIFTIFQFQEYVFLSKIIDVFQQKQIIQHIKEQDSQIQKVRLLLRLNENQLEKGKNLRKYQLRLFDLFRNKYNGFLIIIKTNYKKNIAYYIPRQFEETIGWMPTEQQQAYYWINNNQLIVAKSECHNWFDSCDDWLIYIWQMCINVDRNKEDYACLSSNNWHELSIGNDQYPKKDGYSKYFIAGGQDHKFKATEIEFVGIKKELKNLNNQQILEERKPIINQYLVLSGTQLDNIKTEIDKTNDNISEIYLVFQQNIKIEKNLNKIRKQLYITMEAYKGFIIAIKTNFGKIIAFYIPMQFQEILCSKCSDKKHQLGFYWINSYQQLVTTKNLGLNQFYSDELNFISIAHMSIKNDRNQDLNDYAGLDSDWQARLVDNKEEYPEINHNGNYCIAGAGSRFNATDIEFYGVK